VILLELQPAAEGQLELSLEDDESERGRARLMQARKSSTTAGARARCAWARTKPGTRRTATGGRSRN